MKNKIKILDCTLRDGGYYNNWNFNIDLINKYLKVMSDIRVDYVEIGFRSGEKKEFRGACAYSTDEFLNNLKISSTVIDMSSIKPKIAIKYGQLLKDRNIHFLDAPVSGGTIGAEEGSLAIMVGGDQNVFDGAFDTLKIMGNPTLVGPIGSGQVSKLANQIIVGVTIGAVAEAITLCEKAGVDANKFIKALSGGFADGKILQNHGKRMIDKDFSPKGKVSTHLKDMNNILECAGDFKTKLPISNLIQEMFKSLVDQGNDNDDHSALYKEIENINKS